MSPLASGSLGEVTTRFFGPENTHQIVASITFHKLTIMSDCVFPYTLRYVHIYIKLSISASILSVKRQA